MCGFLLEFRKKRINFEITKFREAAKLISHRGPDQNDEAYLKDISMKFYRLSIRDLTNSGSQPMWDFSKRYLIVFNGEIYNSEELKKRIDSKKLKSTSDTEILVNLYAKYKKDIVNFLDGMYSFIVYDKIEKTCFVVRDRFGIKPLYYYADSKKIVFCSEIKPLIKYIGHHNFNFKALREFFLKGYIDHNNLTFFKNIKSLEPSHFLFIKKNNILKKKYWNLLGPANKEFSDKKKHLKYLLENSINNHLISDRKIGIFLSGGTDSTVLTNIISKKLNYKLKTFTYDFENNHNLGESIKANKIAKSFNSNNFAVEVKPKDIINKMQNLSYKLESPFTSIRIFGTDKLYNIAKKKGIKVIIEGHGGDEMLAGYRYNYFPYLLDKSNISSIKMLNKIKKISSQISKSKIEKNNLVLTLLQQGLSTTDGTPYFKKNVFADYFLDGFNNKFDIDGSSKEINKIGFVKSSQLLDIEKIKLPRILKYSDRLSMNYGIECRVPLLNHELFKFCFDLKNEEKFYEGETRYLFKKTYEKDIKRNFTKQKKTIVDPQTYWLKNELIDFVYDNFNSETVKNSGIFNQKKLIKFYEDFLKGKIKNSFQIFSILTTISFLRVFKKI